MSKRILVAIDETDASKRVAEFVNHFFSEDVEIIGLHVADVGVVGALAPANDDTTPMDPITGPAGAVPADEVPMTAIGGMAARTWWTIYPLEMGVPEGRYGVRMADPALQQEAVARLGSDAIEHSGLKADRTEVDVGDPADAIRHVAEAENVDLIVVGHGHRGLFDRLLSGGSVSRDLAKDAPRPLLIV